jgi:hypothetical protein
LQICASWLPDQDQFQTHAARQPPQNSPNACRTPTGGRKNAAIIPAMWPSHAYAMTPHNHAPTNTRKSAKSRPVFTWSKRVIVWSLLFLPFALPAPRRGSVHAYPPKRKRGKPKAVARLAPIICEGAGPSRREEKKHCLVMQPDTASSVILALFDENSFSSLPGRPIGRPFVCGFRVSFRRSLGVRAPENSGTGL